MELMTVSENSTPNANIFAPIIENSTRKELTINRCKVILNLAPKSDEKTIETVKSILLSAYYQNVSPRAE